MTLNCKQKNGKAGMEYDPKQLELLVQKESSTLEGQLHNLSKKQKNIVNSQLSGLLDVHQ